MCRGKYRRDSGPTGGGAAAVTGCVLVCLAAWCCISPAQAASPPDGERVDLPSPRELAERYLQANGGRSNIESVQTVVLDTRLVYADGTVSPVKIYRKRPNRLRMIREQEGVDVVTVYDGIHAERRYEVDGVLRQVDPVERPAQIEAIRRAARFGSPFLQVLDAGATFAVEAIEKEGALVAYRLRLDPGNATDYREIWLDAGHYQEVSIFPDAASVQRDGITRVNYLEFMRQSGVRYPKRIEYLADGDLVYRAEVRELRNNVGLFDQFFEVGAAAPGISADSLNE